MQGRTIEIPNGTSLCRELGYLTVGGVRPALCPNGFEATPKGSYVACPRKALSTARRGLAGLKKY